VVKEIKLFGNYSARLSVAGLQCQKGLLIQVRNHFFLFSKKQR